MVVQVGGAKRSLLVDTGAEISILREAVPGVPMQSTNVFAKGVTGAILGVKGVQDLECNFEGRKILHSFVIANLDTSRDGIIGWDLLERMGAVIDARRRRMSFLDDLEESRVAVLSTEERKAVRCVEEGSQGSSTNPGEERGEIGEPEHKGVQSNSPRTKSRETVSSRGGHKQGKTLRVEKQRDAINLSSLGNAEANTTRKQTMERGGPWVRAITQVTIPSYSEAVIQARMEGLGNEEVLVEPLIQPQGGLRVARSLSRASRGVMTVKLLNLTASPVKVQKKQLLGQGEIIETDSEEEEPMWILSVERSEPTENEIEEKLSHLEEDDKRLLSKILLQYVDVFQEPGKEGCRVNVQHQIPTTCEKPIAKRPYRVPYHLRPVVEEHLADMLNSGVIEPSTSPWSAPVVLVRKKTTDGSLKYRFCTDFRALNEVTKVDTYPLPLINETLENLGRSRYFTTLDLHSGYHQIPIAKEDQEKTGFTTVGGHFEYKRMAFGLSGAPATFQRLMDNLLAKIKGTECLVYLDDVVVYSETIEEHAERLSHVLSVFKNANLKVNLKKCQFAQRSVNYLGHVVTATGVKPDPEKIQAVKNFPVPKNAKEIRSFLGLAGYYRRFVPEFAHVARPLTELTKKEVRFQWGFEQQQAFHNLKSSLYSDSVLVFPDFSKPFILATDASALALGAVLSQETEEGERPVAYASRQLNSAERNYSTTERELLAVVWATKQFRCYLLGRKFTLVTDHAALKWMLSLRDPSSRLTRWALRLAEFEYVVTHKPGKKHTNADALSRATAIASVTIELSPEKIRREQQVDNWCRELLQSDQGCVEEGIVFWKNDCQDRKEWKIAVPETLRQGVIHNCHGTPWAGHPGVERTCLRVKMRYFWPRLNADVKEYVRHCKQCAERKTPNNLKAPLTPAPEPNEPFELVSMDIVGPLPRTNNGFRYMLTFIDHFTRYAEAIPLKDQTAEAVARAFVDVIVARHGVPGRLLTDQGKNFTSELITATCRFLGIKKIRTTPYHPEGNGRLERLHRTLNESIAHFVRRDGRDWDRWLPYALMAYRSVPHSSTGYSPYFLLHGREMSMPGDFKLPEEFMGSSIEDHLLILRERLENAYEVAVKHSTKSAESRALIHNKKKTLRKFEVGDWVYLFDPAVKPGVSKKYLRPWRGPYRITKRMSDVLYQIEDGSGKLTIIHLNRLKEANPQPPGGSVEEDPICVKDGPPVESTPSESDEGNEAEEVEYFRFWVDEPDNEDPDPDQPTTEPEQVIRENESVASEGEVPEDPVESELEDSPGEPPLSEDSLDSPPGPIDNRRIDPSYRPSPQANRPRARSPYALRSRNQPGGSGDYSSALGRCSSRIEQRRATN